MSYRTELPPLDLDLDIEALERAVALTPRERLTLAATRLRDLVWRHRIDLGLVTLLLVVAAVVHVPGMYRSPARFDDEGTYTAYAWAVQNLHLLAHYTYWYAHPPLGQIQMAVWNTATGSFGRLPYAVATGRELAFVCKLVAVVLMYALGRRLGYRRATAALAVLLFSLSPLAVYFGRTALLDNLVTPWLLAAFWYAASPRRSLAAAVGCATAFAVAVLTKETALLFMPALLLLFWQHSDPRNRRFTATVLMAVMALIGLTYPLYALLKNELFTGPGHVSLQWAIEWQLSGRQGSGSIFDPASTAHSVVHTWTTLDPWGCAITLAAVLPGLLVRRTRAMALALAIQLGSLLRNGYLPYPFVIAMIPFAALTVAGVLDALWAWSRIPLAHPGRRGRELLSHLGRHPARSGGGVLAVVAVCWFVAVTATPWRYSIDDLWHRDRDAGKATALAYLQSRAEPDDVLVVDDAFWVDLVRAGHPRKNVIWFTKLDVDKDVRLPGKEQWKAIDYVLIDYQDALSLHMNRDWTPSKDTRTLFPTLGQALRHARIVAAFGAPADRAVVYRVDPNRKVDAPPGRAAP